MAENSHFFNLNRRTVVAGVGASAMLGLTPSTAKAQTMKTAVGGLNVKYSPKDDAFGAPFIDVDEMRQHPRPHRYVHGGFAGGDTLFSFYFPEPKLYGGRFAHWMEGGAGGNEKSLMIDPAKPRPSQWDYLFDMAFDDLNGYLIESNQGHKVFDMRPDKVPGLTVWRASTESARFSRYVAEQIYGKVPSFGYVGGIGGGGGRAVYCMENAPDVYQGCTPQIIGSSVSQYGAMQRAVKFLGAEKLKDVADAVAPGGSGNPYATLNALQRDALADLYRCGYPRGAENQLKPTRTIGFIYTALERSDPSYFDDFWKLSGYAGKDKIEQLRPYIVERTAKVKSVVPISRSMEPATLEWYGVLPPDLPFAVELDIPGKEEFYGCELTILTGAAKGRNLFINGTYNGLSGFPERTPDVMKGVKPGDEVKLDNRRFLAFIHYFLHSVNANATVSRLTGHPVIQSGRPFAPDGIPLYPQRPAMPGFGEMSTNINGKLIYVNSTHDVYVWPVTAGFTDIYRAKYGDKLDDRYRFFWADNGVIGPPQKAVGYNVGEGDLRVWDTRLINFQHSMGRIVWRHLRDWVEFKKAPPVSTKFHFNADNALVLPDEAAARGGIQPVVNVTASGSSRVEARVGQSVKFDGMISAPPGAGKVVLSEWDFGDGEWNYPFKNPEADGTASDLRVSASHSFTAPGTYFVTLRAGIKPGGAAANMEAIPNLDQVRVVVS